MKKQTKMKIAAVAAVFGLVTLLGTFALVSIEHPAQWYFAGASILALGVAIFTTCTID